MHRNAGAGVYYQEFAHYLPIGAKGIVFEREVKAIKVALLNLIPRIHKFNRAMILIDSKTAIRTVASNIIPKVISII